MIDGLNLASDLFRRDGIAVAGSVFDFVIGYLFGSVRNSVFSFCADSCFQTSRSKNQIYCLCKFKIRDMNCAECIFRVWNNWCVGNVDSDVEPPWLRCMHKLLVEGCCVTYRCRMSKFNHQGGQVVTQVSHMIALLTCDWLVLVTFFCHYQVITIFAARFLVTRYVVRLHYSWLISNHECQTSRTALLFESK